MTLSVSIGLLFLMPYTITFTVKRSMTAVR